MLYGLTQLEDNYYGQVLNKFIAMPACIYYEPMQHYEYVEGYGKMREIGINVIAGPNWDSHAKVICDNMSYTWCTWADSRKNTSPIPLKTFEWSSQIAVTGRFIEYDPLFGKNQSYDTPLISPGLDSINMVPIHILVGEKDTICSVNHAKKIANEIGPAVRSFDIIPGVRHNIVAMNSDKYIIDLVL